MALILAGAATEQASAAGLKATAAEAVDGSQQLPALRSFLGAKPARTQFQPSRVKLEAAQLLPKLHHSQGGIGFYVRVRERAASRSVELWSQQPAIGQPSLMLGPSKELTSNYYSETLVQGKKLVANPSGGGQYPFSRIVYSNLIGPDDQPIGVGSSSHRRADHNTHGNGIADPSTQQSRRSQGTFVLRHKLRQSSSRLSRILQEGLGTSGDAASVRRAISHVK